MGADNKKFWMVWNPNKQHPRFKHDSLEQAEKEAERLAKENQNQKYIVLEAVNYKLVETEKIKVTCENYIEIPTEPLVEIPGELGAFFGGEIYLSGAKELVKSLQENIKNAKK